MAKMIINQVGRPAGVAGQSRSDGLRTGALVTLTHDATDAVFTEFSLLWAPTDDFTAASSFVQVGATATFSPDATSKGGTYRIRMRVSTASTTTDVVRLFAIRTAAANLRIPALNERADETASLVNHGSSIISASEFNEPSVSGPFAGGNYGGWYSAINELAAKVESLAAASLSASSWTPFYSVDLTTLPNQTINGGSDVNTYGTFTMDGQPWYWHGASGHANLVNGQGIVGSANGYRSGGLPYGGYYIGLKLYLMAGWDSTKETFIMVQFSGGLTTMTGTAPRVGCGIWSNTETWGYGPGNNAEITQLYGASTIDWSDGVSKPLLPKLTVEDQSNYWLAARVQPFDISQTRNGRYNYREGLWLRDPLSTAYPDPESFLGLGCENGTGTAQNGQYKVGFFAGTSAGNVAFTATKLRILQRAVT